MIKASCFLPCTPQMIGKEMAPVARAEVLGQISFGASPVGLGRLEARRHSYVLYCPRRGQVGAISSPLSDQMIGSVLQHHLAGRRCYARFISQKKEKE